MKGKRWLCCSLVALVSLALDAPLEAQRRGRGGGDDGSTWKFLAKKYDADGDGRIVRKEYTRDDEHWKNLDVDGNGWVDEKEIASRTRARSRRGPGSRKPPSAKVGEKAPDFELELLVPPVEKGKKGKKGEDQKELKKKPAKPVLVKLSSFAGKRPVALIFGSYT